MVFNFYNGTISLKTRFLEIDEVAKNGVCLHASFGGTNVPPFSTARVNRIVQPSLSSTSSASAFLLMGFSSEAIVEETSDMACLNVNSLLKGSRGAKDVSNNS